MGDKTVNLVRSDGSTLQATPEQAGRLRLLGYQEENPDERFDRNVETGKSNYYSTTGQKVTAGLEGAASSLTLGASDYFLGDDTQERAKYNPGSRMAGEALGALVPLVLGDGAGLAGLAEEAGTASRVGNVARTAVEYSPAGLVSKGATAVLGEGRGLLPAAMRGAAEGAVYGGTNAADHAYLSGDPLTAEAVLHGVGFGAIFGAGLGALGAGVEKAGAHFSEQVKLSGEGTSALEQTAKISDEAYGQLHSELQGMKDTVKSTVGQADEMVTKALSDMKTVTRADFEAPMSGRELAKVKTALTDSYQEAIKAVKAGKSEAADAAIEKFSSVSEQFATEYGAQGGGFMGSAKQSLQELTGMRALAGEVEQFPKTVADFAKMKPERAERMFASLESATKLKSFPEIGDAVKQSVEKFTTAAGVEANGVDGVRAAWSAMKNAPMKAEAAGGGAGLARRAVASVLGAKAGSVVRKATGSSMLGFGAYKAAKGFLTGGASDLASGLLGARNAVLGKIRQLGADYLPAAGRAISRTAPLVEPLAIKLDGTLDNSTKDTKELALRRVQEVNEAAPHVADTLYKAIEPLKATQPELAPALHQTALQAFQALQGMMPKDPGAISKLKTLWRVDPAQQDVLSRQLSVFHDPVQAAHDMVMSGRLDPVKVEALQAFSPEIYQQLRVGLMETVTKPDVISKMSYGDQVAMSALLDLPIHSSMSPQFIASQQQIFTQRNQPNATPKISMPGGSNGGRPSGPANNKDSTAAQRITEH